MGARPQEEIGTMPLDTLARQTTVAELHYLKRGAEKPVRYVPADPPPGVPAWNGIDDPHEVRSRMPGAGRRIHARP